MKIRLFHVSTSESTISHFHPLAHLGSLTSAVRYASRNAIKNLPKTLYEVDVTFPHDFLLTPDLSAASNGEVHMAGSIAQILGAGTWRSSKLPKTFFDGIVARAANYGPNPAAADLVAGMKAQGFSALTYVNRHDGQHADDWIVLDPAGLRIVHLARWSDPTGVVGVKEPVTLFNHWQIALNAIVNARLFLLDQMRAILPYADRAFHDRFWAVVTGLDQSQRGLAAGAYVSSALMRKRMVEALSLIREATADAGPSQRRAALEIADELALAIEDGIDNPDVASGKASVRLRTPFVPLSRNVGCQGLVATRTKPADATLRL